MSDQNVATTGQVLGASTAAAGAIKVLPETGYTKFGLILAGTAIICSGVILLSFIARRVIVKYF